MAECSMVMGRPSAMGRYSEQPFCNTFLYLTYFILSLFCFVYSVFVSIIRPSMSIKIQYNTIKPLDQGVIPLHVMAECSMVMGRPCAMG